jgi:acyl-CoA thioesterase
MLDDDTQLETIGPGRFLGEITDRWSVRAPNGGYVASYVLRALMHESPVPDPVTLNVQYVAPAAPGPATFDVEVLRAGRSHATLQARLFQGELVAAALATFGRRREGGRELLNMSMPSLPPPEKCSPRIKAEVPGAMTIGLRFDDRIPPGSHPELGGAGGGTATAGGWKRLLDRELDSLAVPLFLDAWPPSIWGATEARAGFAPTIDLTVHWRATPRLPWHFVWFTTAELRGGYLVEDGELWGADGTLVAQSRQLARFVEEPRS